MIIGIGGVSRTGKTALAKRLRRHFKAMGHTAIILHQDDFVFPEEDIPKIRGKVDWEHPDSINFTSFRQALKKHAGLCDAVIAEGLMAFYNDSINTMYNKCFFLEISKATFLKRKAEDLRWGREPDWYMEHIWESFLKYGQVGESLPEVLRVNGEQAIDWENVLNFLKSSDNFKLPDDLG